MAFATTPDGALMGAGASGQRALELGPVSYGAGSRGTNVQIRRFSDRFVVTTKFGLIIQDESKRHGSATVLACLAYPEMGYALRLDGVKLSRTPQMISGQSPLGTVAHRLEIEVPTSLTEKDSQIRNAIIFQIIPN